ncbi:MAG: phosphoribosylanthranilate isomerase [Chloroflexi bacterium]|nr:phosphoribosylanthranilate isomerase [Chloroflexota bacterium]
MTKVMICGSRRAEDIQLLVEAGVDGIGLITEVWQKIACNLSREQARKLRQAIPPLISTVLILTEERMDEICRLTEHISPDAVQLHGFNAPEEVAGIKEKLKVKIVKTLHFQGESMAEGNDPVACARQYIAAGADAILVDSYGKDKVGATGETMSLSLSRTLRDALYPVPLIMAGGLDSENVSHVLNQVKPYAVDVFSGVTTGGYLDSDKVREFMKRVRTG